MQHITHNLNATADRLNLKRPDGTATKRTAPTLKDLTLKELLNSQDKAIQENARTILLTLVQEQEQRKAEMYHSDQENGEYPNATPDDYEEWSREEVISNL